MADKKASPLYQPPTASPTAPPPSGFGQAMGYAPSTVEAVNRAVLAATMEKQLGPKLDAEMNNLKGLPKPVKDYITAHRAYQEWQEQGPGEFHEGTETLPTPKVEPPDIDHFQKQWIYHRWVDQKRGVKS